MLSILYYSVFITLRIIFIILFLLIFFVYNLALFICFFYLSGYLKK